MDRNVFGKWLLLIGLSALSSCSEEQGPKYIRVQSSNVDNLLKMAPQGDGIALASDTYSRLEVRDRCLILRWDKKNWTPLFVFEADKLQVSDSDVIIGEARVPLRRDISTPGLFPVGKDESLGKCPSTIIAVSAINL